MVLIVFGVFALTLVIGVPVGFAIALSAMAALAAGDISMLVVVQRMFASIDSFPLIAVPFFILAGDILSRGSISGHLVDFAQSILGRVRGGLSVVSVAAGVFFASISGSGAATTAVVGTSLIPQLNKHGYKASPSAALIAAAGTIGVVMPPSIPMVLYAVVAGQSVTLLFRNGFIPGILMALALVVIAIIQAYKHGYPKGDKFSIRVAVRAFSKAFWGLIMPVIILGGIFSGVFTPSEAAVVAVVYAALVSKLIYRDFSLRDFYQIMVGSARTSAVIMLIIACSGALSWVMANWRIPGQIANTVLGFSDNRYVIMLLISLVILLAGAFLETSSAIVLLTPVFLPLVNYLGINLIHFGVIFVVGLAIGMITPPIAINLFVASSITGIPIERIAKSVTPCFLGLTVIFFIIVFLPLFFPAIIW